MPLFKNRMSQQQRNVQLFTEVDAVIKFLALPLSQNTLDKLIKSISLWQY